MHNTVITASRAGEISRPEDLLPLHRKLTEEADQLAHDGDQAAAQACRHAAGTVHSLWGEWSHRQHARDVHAAMRTAANRAISAVAEGLACATTGETRELYQWLDLAERWIADIRMQARPHP